MGTKSPIINFTSPVRLLSEISRDVPRPCTPRASTLTALPSFRQPIYKKCDFYAKRGVVADLRGPTNSLETRRPFHAKTRQSDHRRCRLSTFPSSRGLLGPGGPGDKFDGGAEGATASSNHPPGLFLANPPELGGTRPPQWLCATKNAIREDGVMHRTVVRLPKAAGGTRTLDLRITNAPLYRLSYSGKVASILVGFGTHGKPPKRERHRRFRLEPK